MDIETANRNYYDKEFYNITEFDKLITSKNQIDEESKKFFAKNPAIMGIYVSSNHVNVYIILFDGNIRLPSKVDVKEERNMRYNDDKLKRKYVIVYCFSKDDFMAQWNSVVLRSKRDKSYAHEFYFPFRYNSDYPKINVILDIKKSPIRYYTDDEYELPDDVTSESDNDDDKQLITPLKPPTDVVSRRKNETNTPTMASASGLEFTLIPKETTYANIMQSIKARVQQTNT